MPESFWTWAVAHYARPGVAPLCLALQDDHAQNIPLLLWAAWAAPCSRIAAQITVLPLEPAITLARTWSDDVIIPLRRLRRRLKTTVSQGDDDLRLPLRETVRAAELDAEHALMQQLESLVATGQTVPPSAHPATTLDALLATAGAWSGQSPSPGLAQRLADLTQALTKTEILGYNDADGKVG